MRTETKLVDSQKGDRWADFVSQKVTRTLDIRFFLCKICRKRNLKTRSNALQRFFVSEETERQAKADKGYTPRRGHLPSVFLPLKICIQMRTCQPRSSYSFLQPCRFKTDRQTGGGRNAQRITIKSTCYQPCLHQHLLLHVTQSPKSPDEKLTPRLCGLWLSYCSCLCFL